MLDLLRAQFLDVVDEQLRENDPVEVRRHYDRLLRAGYAPPDARNLLASCLAVEMFDMMEENRMFDNERYQAHLERLPELPFKPEMEGEEEME